MSVQSGKVLPSGSIAARMNRIPVTYAQAGILIMIGVFGFFDDADLGIFGYAAPSLEKYWHLPVSTIGFITSAAFVGLFVGDFVGGWISDTLGRRLTLIVGTLWFSVFSL